MEVVLVFPVDAVQMEFLFSEDGLGEDALLPHHLEFIRRVHRIFI